MKKILLLLLILSISLSFLIFHDRGNALIKPYVESYLLTKMKPNMSLKINHLKIDLNYLEIEAMLNKLTKINAKGSYSLLSQTFDLDYTLTSDGFKNEQLSFENKIDINGTVIGTYDDMHIQGQGETLQSYIDYKLNLKENLVNNVQVKMNQADVASLLQLASQPAYAEGKVDIDINIPTFKEADTKGNAKILLHKTTVNQKVLKESLNIDIPEKTTITANLNAKVSTEVFKVEGDIKSNLAWLQLINANYHVQRKEFSSNYKLLAPQLSKLTFLTKQQLRGQLQIDGEMKIKQNRLFIEGKSKDLGGLTSFDYNGQKLNVAIHNMQIAKLLYMLNEKPYATGKLIANLNIEDLKKLNGSYKLQTIDAKTVNSTFKKALNLNFDSNSAFKLNSKGTIASGLVHLENTLYSDIFQYRSTDMQYNFKEKTLQSSYTLDIPQLSKLNRVVGKPLQGELKINGTLKHHKALILTGLSKSMGGEINFKLQEQKFNATLSNIPVENFMHTLSYPQIFKGTLLGDFYYDLKMQKGTLATKLNQARLLPNKLTDIIKQLRGLDLTKERYNESYFNAYLNKNLVNIDFKAQSKKLLLEIPTGEINKATNQINAKYTINFDNKNIAGSIKGDVSNPKVTIDSAKFIKDKLLDVIKKNIDDNKLKELGIGTKEKDAIKNFLGDLFK